MGPGAPRSRARVRVTPGGEPQTHRPPEGQLRVGRYVKGPGGRGAARPIPLPVLISVFPGGLRTGSRTIQGTVGAGGTRWSARTMGFTEDPSSPAAWRELAGSRALCLCACPALGRPPSNGHTCTIRPSANTHTHRSEGHRNVCPSCPVADGCGGWEMKASVLGMWLTGQGPCGVRLKPLPTGL